MRELAALAFGSEPGKPRAAGGPKPPGHLPFCGGVPAPAGAWCQTPPGDAALKWLDGVLRARGRGPGARGRGPGRDAR
ncbi:MAG TPA: hypothetical protein VKV38_17315 [Trebonia sp.]|nr:hypothetical protein [Trebonia sp.]